MNRFILSIASLLVATTSFGQISAVKDALKLAKGETPDFNAAIRMADAAISNPEAQNSCEAWYIKGQIYQKQFEFEQDKLFQVPPQNPNQEIQSEAAYKAFETWLIADSLDVVESQNNPKRKGKLKYRSDIAKFVYKYKDYASNYGAILFQEGKVEEANRIFAQITDMPSLPMFSGYDKMNPSDSTFILAKENYRMTAINVYNNLLQKEDTVSAEAYAKKMNEEFPEDPTFLTKTLQHDLWAGRNAQAEKKLNKAIEMDPNNYIYYLVRANIYGLNRATKAQAEPDYQKAMQLAPENAKYNVIYAYGDFKRGVGDDAYNFYVDNERRNPAAALKSQDDFIANYKQAIDLLEQAHNLKSPADDALLNELQQIYTKLRSFYYSKKDNTNMNYYDQKRNAIRAERGY
ncbi:MAG: hypothetical protein K5633_05145 [Paludibacteraceae bacterium]|nr:hypothetical protein [Paludibacteraceae bacterium]